MIRPARIPNELIERNTIEQLPVGHYAYVVPWAIFCNEHGELWFVKGYTTHQETGGTVQTYIKRVDGGILVDRTTMKPMSPHRPVYAGCTYEDYMPVLGFFNDEPRRPVNIYRENTYR